MKPWGTCSCGFVAATLLAFTKHLDEHAGVERDSDWYVARASRSYAQWDDATAPVVFIHEKTGQVRYPGQNSAKCPAGYKREYMRSLREVERFEKEHGVRSEVAWFDRGSGRGHDDYLRGEKLTH